jgi:hypothetical protein
MKGPAGQQLKETVIIIPEKDYPFKILEYRPVRGTDIGCNLSEIKKPDGTEYRLVVESLKKQEYRFFDTICLKTDSRIQPEIRISVYGTFTK